MTRGSREAGRVWSGSDDRRARGDVVSFPAPLIGALEGTAGTSEAEGPAVRGGPRASPRPPGGDSTGRSDTVHTLYCSDFTRNYQNVVGLQVHCAPHHTVDLPLHRCLGPWALRPTDRQTEVMTLEVAEGLSLAASPRLRAGAGAHCLARPSTSPVPPLTGARSHSASPTPSSVLGEGSVGHSHAALLRTAWPGGASVQAGDLSLVRRAPGASARLGPGS